MDFAKRIQSLENQIEKLQSEIVRLAYRITELETPRKKSNPADETTIIEIGNNLNATRKPD